MIPSALTSVALSQQDAAFYEQNSYLLIEGALAPNLLAELKAAADALCVRAEQQKALEPQGKLNLRNCIVHHDAFLQLLDHPTTAPLARQILGWNIQMNNHASHRASFAGRTQPREESPARLALRRGHLFK